MLSMSTKQLILGSVSTREYTDPHLDKTTPMWIKAYNCVRGNNGVHEGKEECWS